MIDLIITVWNAWVSVLDAISGYLRWLFGLDWIMIDHQTYDVGDYPVRREVWQHKVTGELKVRCIDLLPPQ